jgi:hypothetical protein
LWSTFGISRLKPYDDNYSREQMRNWKMQENVKKAYDDLYSAIEPDNPESEICITLIIKSVFVSDEEQTDKNAIWTQAILEMIFDEEYLSTKIDSDSIDSWYAKLNQNKVSYFISFIIFQLLFFKYFNIFVEQ